MKLRHIKEAAAPLSGREKGQIHNFIKDIISGEGFNSIEDIDDMFKEISNTMFPDQVLMAADHYNQLAIHYNKKDPSLNLPQVSDDQALRWTKVRAALFMYTECGMYASGHTGKWSDNFKKCSGMDPYSPQLDAEQLEISDWASDDGEKTEQIIQLLKKVIADPYNVPRNI